MEFDAIEVLASGLAFPEGPLVEPDGSVLFVEMLGGRVSRWCAQDGVSVVAEVEGGPNGAARGPDGNIYVCNNGGRHPDRRRPACIQRIDRATGAVEELYTTCDGRPFASPNDIVFDETGHFWFSDLRGNAIYYAAADGSSISCAVEGILGPNGVGLSPDGRVLYWAQTHTRQVMRRFLSGPGEVIPSPGMSIAALIQHGSVDPDTLVIGLPGAQELDSLAVEAGGYVCVGTLVDSGVTVVSPEGSVVEKFILPQELSDGAVTNLCFGGEDMRTAYVTLSLTGRLVRCDWPRPGLPLAF